MSSDPTLNKEYLPLSGMQAFTEALTKLLLGESSLAITQNRVRLGLHCVSCERLLNFLVIGIWCTGNIRYRLSAAGSTVSKVFSPILCDLHAQPHLG